MKPDSAPLKPLILAAALSLFFAGCGPSSQTPAPSSKGKESSASPPANVGQPSQGARAATPSAERTSFNEVTAHLDPGGSVYAYLSTEQWFKGASEKLAGLHSIIDGIPNMKAEDRANLGRLFDVVTNLVRVCGVEEMSGFGLSGIAIEKGVYRTTTMLHHYKGQNSGYLWSMFGKSPHALAELDLLPPSTALAIFVEADLPQVWKALQMAINRLNIPDASEKLRAFPAQFELGTGLNFEKLLESFGGQFGIILTLNEASSATIRCLKAVNSSCPNPDS